MCGWDILLPCFPDSKLPFVSVSDSSVAGRLKPVVLGNIGGGQVLTSPGQKAVAINYLTFVCAKPPVSFAIYHALKSSSALVNV